MSGAPAAPAEGGRGVAGKVAIVTGGSSGIGLAAAELLVRGGAAVVIAARGKERGAAAAERLAGEGRAAFVRADVTSPAEVEAMVAAAAERFGGVDILVNNAAETNPEPALSAEVDEEGFRRSVEAGLLGAWRCQSAAVRRMLAQGRGGAVVNVSSIHGLAGVPGGAAYGASKAGVISLTRTAALEYARFGVRVNAVCPGFTVTPALERSLGRQGEERAAQMRAALEGQVPLGRLARPEECAEAIVWLCSGAASYVTGSVLVVDGGYTAGG